VPEYHFEREKRGRPTRPSSCGASGQGLTSFRTSPVLPERPSLVSHPTNPDSCWRSSEAQRAYDCLSKETKTGSSASQVLRCLAEIRLRETERKFPKSIASDDVFSRAGWNANLRQQRLNSQGTCVNTPVKCLGSLRKPGGIPSNKSWHTIQIRNNHDYEKRVLKATCRWRAVSRMWPNSGLSRRSLKRGSDAR
jgi:hypothetical protein